MIDKYGHIIGPLDRIIAERQRLFWRSIIELRDILLKGLEEEEQQGRRPRRPGSWVAPL